METFVMRTTGGRHPLAQVVLLDRGTETPLVELKGQRWHRVRGAVLEVSARGEGPVWSAAVGGFELPHAVGMRLALGLVAAQSAVHCRFDEWAARERFLRRFGGLPDEVVLYWFTGCFYGLKQAAFRAAFVALLTTAAQDD